MRRAPRWVVTRQMYWPDGEKIVEIAAGGRDYANADALCAEYPGEFEEFTDPREAAETGIAILKAWRADGARAARIATGATLGFTMPFEPSTIPQVRDWARRQYDALEKCAECGELLGDERFGSSVLQEFDCCSERCAERRYFVEEAA